MPAAVGTLVVVAPALQRHGLRDAPLLPVEVMGWREAVESSMDTQLDALLLYQEATRGQDSLACHCSMPEQRRSSSVLL